MLGSVFQTGAPGVVSKGKEPGLSVSGRVDGGGYTVSEGARSLSISNPDGAAVSTEVKKASDNGVISVTNPTSVSPSWAAPGGGSTGESVQVKVTAIKGGFSTSISFVERVAGSGDGGSSGITDVLDLDFETLATAPALSAGNQSLTISGKSVSADFSTYSGANGTVTPTNTVGAVYDGGTDTSGTVTSSYLISPHFPSFTVEDVRKYQYAVHVVLADLVYPSPSNSSVFVGLNRGNNVTHNSGIARMVFPEDANDGTNERIRLRRNTSSSAIQATTAVKTIRVITLILTGGEIIEAMDTSGSTPPVPAPGASGTMMIGSDAVGLGSAAPSYQANGLRCFVSAGDASDFTLKRIFVQRF